MFYGLSGLFADLLVILGPVLILSVEGPRFFQWLERRRLEPAFSASVPDQVARGLPQGDASGLLDRDSTERIHMGEWLRRARASAEPAAAPQSQSAQSILVGGAGATEHAVRPSRREPRS